MVGGDQLVFSYFYDRYVCLLMSYFMWMLWKDCELVEDFFYDLFIKLVYCFELFDINCFFKIWVYLVVNNMCKNEYKCWEVRKNILNGFDSFVLVLDVNKNIMNQVYEWMFKEVFDE